MPVPATPGSRSVGLFVVALLTGCVFLVATAGVPISSGALAVADEPSLDLTASNVTASPGETAVVDLALENVGTETVPGPAITLDLDGDLAVDTTRDDGGGFNEDERAWLWIDLGPGETVEPSVTVAVPDEPGEYTIDVRATDTGGERATATATVTVEERTGGDSDGSPVYEDQPDDDGSDENAPDGSEAVFELDFRELPDTPQPGDEISVTVTVTNTGNRSATKFVQLSVAAYDVVDQQPVTIEPNEHTVLTLDSTIPIYEDSDVVVHVATEDDVVEERVELGESIDDGDETTTSNDAMHGTGPLVALLVVCLTVVFAGRLLDRH